LALATLAKAAAINDRARNLITNGLYGVVNERGYSRQRNSNEVGVSRYVRMEEKCLIYTFSLLRCVYDIVEKGL